MELRARRVRSNSGSTRRLPRKPDCAKQEAKGAAIKTWIRPVIERSREGCYSEIFLM